VCSVPAMAPGKFRRKEANSVYWTHSIHIV